MALLFYPVNASQNPTKNDISLETSPLKIIISEIVSFYQVKISSKSIERCPFTISCSKFLITEIDNHRIMKGFALFIDRYFYRENISIPKHYPLKINNKFLYDDTISNKYINYLYRD